MMEVQAAVGLRQLQKMPQRTQTRQHYGRRILSAARQFHALRVPARIEHAFYKCYVFIEPSHLKDGWTRDRIIDVTRQLQVLCFSGSCPEVYLEKAFDGTSYRPLSPLPVARELGETSLMFLVRQTKFSAVVRSWRLSCKRPVSNVV